MSKAKPWVFLCPSGRDIRGFPWEERETALRGFVFLFRPPGLAPATDGTGWAHECLLFPDSPLGVRMPIAKGTSHIQAAAFHMERKG